MTIKIAFFSNQLCERGTTVNLYNYAYFSEKLINATSYIFYYQENINNVDQTIDQFNKSFPNRVFAIDNFYNIDPILLENQIPIIFLVKSGENDGLLSKVAKNIVSCVFNASQPHGDLYTTVSSWVRNYKNQTILPNLIWLPTLAKTKDETEDDLRKELDIPQMATVFGRHGGRDRFNHSWVHQIVYQVAKSHPNIYFLFVNTDTFCPVIKNIIHMDKITDTYQKTRFIKTCDAMLWSRIDGETFGMAIAEFSICNKPVIASKSGKYQAHVHLLGDRAIWYNRQTLENILTSFDRVAVQTDYPPNHWDVFQEYGPEPVIDRLKEAIKKTFDIGIAMITWRKPKTLLNTLESYRKNGLLNWIQQKVIVLQDSHPEEHEIATQFGFETIESTNLGIGCGIIRATEGLKTKYVLILENDWFLNSTDFNNQLFHPSNLIAQGKIDCYRLRHRKKPGHPLWSMIAFKGKELSAPQMLLDCVHWIENPEKEFPEQITKITKIVRHPIYNTTAEFANYTNNPCLYDRNWFLEKMSPHFEHSKGRDNEVEISEWWRHQHFIIGQGDGLFTHTDLKR